MCPEGVQAGLPAHATVLWWKLSDFPGLCAHFRLYEAFKCCADGSVELSNEVGDLSWGVVRIR